PVLQPFFLYFSRSVVKDRDLLKPRMKITAYNQHDVGSSHEPWSCLSQPNLLAVTGQRRYAIKRSEGSEVYCEPRRVGRDILVSLLLVGRIRNRRDQDSRQRANHSPVVHASRALRC